MDILDDFDKEFEFDNEFKDLGAEVLAEFTKSSGDEDSVDTVFSSRYNVDSKIKMEFTCESEQVMDPNITKESLTDSHNTETAEINDSYAEEEVSSIATGQSDYDLMAAAENCGIDVSIYKSCQNNVQNCNDTDLASDITEKHDDDQLSNIMSDHNYMSQEEITGDTIRQNLINHFKRKITDNYEHLPNNITFRTKKIVNFVNNLMERIDHFNLMKSEDDLTEEDLFVQNIFDAVVAEDAAEENDRDKAENESHKDVLESTSESPNKRNMDTSGTESLPSTAELSKADLPPPPPPPPQPLQPSKTPSTSDYDKQSAINDEILPENCSEPLEHSDVVFDVVEKIQPTVVIPLLDDLSKFAKLLSEDCENFRKSSSLNEQQLTDYVQLQLKKFQLFTNTHSVTIGVQTDSHQHQQKMSKRKSRKLNMRNKLALLATSESDSSTDTELTSDPEVDVNPIPMEDDHALQNDNNLHVKTSSEITLNKSISKTFNEYDDGISLVKYVQSEIFETELYERSSSASEDEHRQESICNKEENKNNNENENQKKPTSNDESDKENDKEIERLINLNGLASRRSNNNGIGAVKNTDGNLIEKPKTKALTQKSRSDELLNFMDDNESDREVASDESINESDEEITEQTYLKRYNEEFKMQLLNSSSSEGDDSEYDATIADSDKLDNRSNDVDNDDSKGSPTLDKFLKSFNADAELDTEDDDNDEPKVKEQTTVAQSETAAKIESSNGECIKNDAISADRQVTTPTDLQTEKSNLSTDNSDCELLTDNFNFRKRESKPKSLEKLIKDADKRRKTNSLLVDDELISLSSASDCSDVEAVDAEADESSKSRIIKPMLRQDQLAGETRKAQKNEEERIRRLEKKQSQLAKALKEQAKEYQKGDLILDYNEEKKTFIKVHSDIVKHMKKHQIEGVKFLYDSCYGGLEALKKSGGSGCILAHCMGLGKTLQLIALLHTVISYRELKTTKILVLCPKSTVMNWADEIVRWIGHISMKNLKVYKFSDTSDINEKISVLKEWSQSTPSKAGCLLIGYEAFRRLVFFHSYKSRGNTSSSVLEDIRDKVVKYLLKPGADLVVCDEGHIIKNRKSAISLAVAEIVTPKRIILTGTPIQNNLKEYYSMVNFIKPLFLGTEKEFANLYANPIRNGQHKDSSKKDIKIMKQRSFVLHKKLSKFVQRKEAELLKSFLPQKFEYVLFIPLTEVQNNLYEYILSAIPQREENRGRGLITDYTCLRKIWTHPKVLEMAWRNAINQKYKRDVRKNPNPNSDDDQPDDIYDSQTGVMSVTNDWWRHLVTDNDLESTMPSNKLRTMFEIIRMSSEKDEKCLIFSAFVAVLNVVEYFFKKITEEDPETMKELNIVNNNRGKNTWISGKDYYRLDGKTSKSIRHEMVQRFNAAENKRARVFLISAKAGGQGINLTGANRVIILDTSWNPSNDQQNIFRIFRLGQKRNCYIYRLLAMGTMEEKVYSRSVTKQAMSFRVVDEQQIDRHYSMAELTELYTLTKPDYAQREVPVLPQDSVLISLLRNYPQMVYKYHEHDSLLENKVEQELSEQEKADAWNAYERDLQLSTELREMPNLELLQQNFGPSKMPNFLGTYPGPDMSALFNYGMGQQPPAPSALSSPHYNPYSSPFSTTGNSYMDMLNLYRKYTQPSFAYPEISKSLRDNFNPGVFNAAQLTSSALLGAAAAGAGPPQPSAASNPLSALGDMSIYPMMSKSLPPPLPTSSSGVGVGGSGPSSLFPVHLTPSSNPFEQYNKALSMYQNLYSNYSDYQQASNAAAAVSAAAAAKNKYDASPFLPPAPAPLPSAPPPYQPHPPAMPPISPQLQAAMKSTSNNLNSISSSNSHNNNNNNNNSNSNSNSHRAASRENSGSSRTDGAYHQSSRSSSSLLPPATATVPTPSGAAGVASAVAPPPAAPPAPAPISQPINMHASADSGLVLSKLPPKLSNAPAPLPSAAFGNAAKVNQSNQSPSTVGSSRGTPPQPPINQTSQSVSKPPVATRNSNATQSTTQQFPIKTTSATLPPNRGNAVSNKPSAPNAPPSMGKTPLQAASNNTMGASKLSVSQKRVHLTGKPGSPTPNIAALARSLLKASSAVTPTSATAPAVPTASIPSTLSTTVTGATSSRAPAQVAASTGKAKQHSLTSGGAMTITSTSTSSSAPNNNNMGIVYPANASTVQRIGKADVQIIPTTTQASPVAPSKPFGDISPSISLTALRNTTSNAAANSNSNSNNNNSNNSGSSKQLTTATIKQISNTSKPAPASTNSSNQQSQQPKATNSSSNNSNNNNNNSGKMNSTNSSLSINKFIKKLPAQLNAPHRGASASTHATSTAASSNASASVKMAAANAVLAKANSAAAFQNYYLDAKQQRRTASPIRSAQTAAAAAAAITKRNNSLSGNSSVGSNSSGGSGAAPVIRRIKEGSGVRSPLTINAVTTANANSSGNFVLSGGMNLKIVPKTAITNQTSQAASSSSGNGGGVTVQKRSTSTMSAAAAAAAASATSSSPTSSSTAAMATSATTATATASSGNKNALNIRTIDGKPNSGVYIIETNINEKRVAIGAATKSGGGTTVTKVLPGIKRKATDMAPSTQGQHSNPTTASSSGAGGPFNSDSSKRVKLSTASGMRLKLNER